MALLPVLFALGLIIELVSYTRPIWVYRRALHMFCMAVNLFFMVVLVMVLPGLWSVLIAICGAYRLFNNARVIQDRPHPDYLRRSSLRTSLSLAIVQLVVLTTWIVWESWLSTGYATWTTIAALQFVVATVLLASVVRSIQKTKWPAKTNALVMDKLPTLTVAIPARNETDDLRQCLESVVTSSYPKLEVLVLDDCSQNKSTPEIIRSFAHAGVRFIKGSDVRANWLAKNQAYDQLLSQTSGEYVLFCGVDVRFKPDSLGRLMSVLLSKNKTMMSVLPEREPTAYGTTSLLQAIRYWWELVPPRRLLRRPPVLSTCWVIKRRSAEESGGFKAVARSVLPEAFFARKATESDGYSFMRASSALGITSGKSVSGQSDTMVRMRYPQLHRRPEAVLLHLLFVFAALLGPFGLLVVGFWLDIGLAAHLLALLASVFLAVVHEVVVLSTRVNTWWFGLVAPPLMLVRDILLTHYSMWKYEFSSVDWKGRNICIPAMRQQKSPTPPD